MYIRYPTRFFRFFGPLGAFLNGAPAPVLPSRATFAQQLAEEPLAQIMLGNKELFHSNMPAWIFHALPDEADQVFGSFVEVGVGGAELRVEREKENIDLAFHWPVIDPLVIESKVFSVPGPKQLDSYAKRASKWDNSPSKMLLLSPTRSGFIEDDYQTRYTNKAGRLGVGTSHLDRLAELLQLAFDGRETSYEVETVQRYSTVLFALDGLVGTTRIRSVDERVADHINNRLVRQGQAPTAYSLFSNALAGVSSFFEVQSEVDNSALAGNTNRGSSA